MTLTNRFILVGLLSEIRADIFRSHVKVKLEVNVKGYDMTLYSTISKRFNKDKYESILSLIPLFRPKSGGWVYVNDEHHYEIKSDDTQPPTKLFVSGNIVPLNGIMLFNFEYIEIAKSNVKEGIKLNIEGQFVDNNKMVNIVYDSPRLFNIKPNCQVRFDRVYNLELRYCPEYNIKNRIITQSCYSDQFLCYNVKETNKSIPQDQMDEYMVEWDIINNNEV